MLNAPDLLPNAAMNRWIQGIMLFDFVLKHVPGRTHLAADALSRRPRGAGEGIEEEDDDWLDDIALYIGLPGVPSRLLGTMPNVLGIEAKGLPSYVFARTIRLDESLKDIHKFLATLEVPSLIVSRIKDGLSRRLPSI